MEQQETKNQKTIEHVAIFGLLVIVFGLIVTILVMNRYRVSSQANDTVLQDSVTLLMKQLDSSHIRQARLESDYNTLLNRDPQILYRNHEKTKFIFNTASPTQLDSIIRSVWYHKRY